ncbi:MAG: tetratricopeptide repeat protein [Fimbriimonadales bacterium]
MLLDRDARRGRAQEAVQQISGLTRRYPQSAGLWFLLGVGYLDLKDLEKSEADIRRALALDAKTPGAYTVLAEINFAKGSADKAELNLRAAIKANPRSIVNYVALESLYESENHWDEAMRLSERAHQIDPDSPIVANQLAYLYLEHGGDVNDAVTLARMAKQKMPDSPQAADTLGWAYYKSGAPESAVLPLRESARKVPNNATYQYHLGMAYMAGGHLDSAERCLRQALEDDPKFPDATLARVALGKISKGMAVR